ncbi:hypothetical protein ONS96_001903 [Cadophora gregata f. sp. sojae]|nr:hypothetical protein ONS96_001903 [Cadophora gregata f. sp. sojae]
MSSTVVFRDVWKFASPSHPSPGPCALFALLLFAISELVRIVSDVLRRRNGNMRLSSLDSIAISPSSFLAASQYFFSTVPVVSFQCYSSSTIFQLWVRMRISLLRAEQTEDKCSKN